MTAVNIATALLVLVSFPASFGVLTGRMKLQTTCVLFFVVFAVVVAAAVYDRQWWYCAFFVLYMAACAVIWRLAWRQRVFRKVR